MRPFRPHSSQDVFQSMDALRAEFEALVRPSGLPPPGEPLPREQVAVDQVRLHSRGFHDGFDFFQSWQARCRDRAGRRCPGACVAMTMLP